MAKYFVLNTGAKIPSVGLGTWQIQPEAVYDAIYTAVKVLFFAAVTVLFDSLSKN
jgi:diketogulonate reductase-like aldo/keto reductase